MKARRKTSAPRKLSGLGHSLKQRTPRWVQAWPAHHRCAELVTELETAFPGECQWFVPEQYSIPETREAIDRSQTSWAIADALHLDETAMLTSFVKVFLSQNPKKHLLLLCKPGCERLELPPTYGEKLEWCDTLPVETPNDEALLRHARRLQPKYTLANLITGPKLRMKLNEAISYIQTKQFCEQDWGFKSLHSRGHGVTLVFHGESGTGKTMAAEVVANTLSLPLYQVDLAAVVSKYIGDTEKNLKQIFNAAREARGILLFDEGDAIFGSRTDVKGSNDRYSNLEVNFLLQELESFDGIVILSTNHEKSMDPAFLRRFTYALNFGRPARSLRAKIWAVNCPKALPLADDIDFDYLAKFVLTGGNIRNCIRDAAAYAAAAGKKLVQQTDFLWAIKRELQKHGIELSREMIGEDKLWRQVGSEWEYRHFSKAPI